MTNNLTLKQKFDWKIFYIERNECTFIDTKVSEPLLCNIAYKWKNCHNPNHNLTQVVVTLNPQPPQQTFHLTFGIARKLYFDTDIHQTNLGEPS